MKLSINMSQVHLSSKEKHLKNQIPLVSIQCKKNLCKSFLKKFPQIKLIQSFFKIVLPLVNQNQLTRGKH